MYLLPPPSPISTSLSRDVLSEGQILHFLFLQCMTLFPMQSELSEARIQILSPPTVRH